MKPSVKVLATFVIIALAGNTACSREARKRKHLERADRLSAAGKYREAAVSYRQAIKMDVRFGEAHYRLGLAELKLQEFERAVLSLQRAALLMPERMEIKALLGQIYLDGFLSDPRRPRLGRETVEAMAGQLLAKDPNSFDGLRLKGHLAKDQGNLEGALELMTRATNVRPLDPDATAAIADIFVRQNRLAEARKLAEELIQAHKDYGPIYDLLYRLHMAQGHTADAEQVLKTKQANNPKEVNYILQLAAHYAAVNQPTEMDRMLQQILTNPEQFPHGIMKVGDFYWMRFDYRSALQYFQQGERVDAAWKAEYQKRQVNVLIAQGKPDDAERIVDTLLASDRKDRDVRHSKAALLIQTGNTAKVQQGQQILKDLIQERSGDPSAHFDLGRSYLATGKVEMAKAEIQEAVHLNHLLTPARVALAEISYNEGHFQDTLETSAAAMEIEPENFRARLLHAWALQGLGHLVQARQELQELDKHFPQRPEAQVAVARMDITLGNFKEAEEKLQRMYRPGQGDPAVLREMITLYTAEKQPARALTLMMEELKAHPDSEALTTLYAMAAVLNGDTELAIRQYQKLATVSPSNDRYRVALSELYYNRGDVAAALSNMERAVAANPNKVEYVLLLGGLVSASGKTEEAREYYRRALKMDPMNTGAMNNLAYNLAESGANLDEAYVLATQASQRDSSPDVLDTLGWVYLKKNMTESSLRIFNELTSRYPNRSVYRYHLGMALLQKGDRAKAKAELTAALAKKPSQREEQKIRSALAF